MLMRQRRRCVMKMQRFFPLHDDNDSNNNNNGSNDNDTGC